MPSYGQGRDHPGPRRAALIGGGGLTDVKVTAADGAWSGQPPSLSPSRSPPTTADVNTCTIEQGHH